MTTREHRLGTETPPCLCLALLYAQNPAPIQIVAPSTLCYTAPVRSFEYIKTAESKAGELFTPSKTHAEAIWHYSEPVIDRFLRR